MLTRAVDVDTDDVTADSLHVEASLEVLAQVRAHIRSVVRRLGADGTAVSGLVQAVDEWLTNVTVHGYGGTPDPSTSTSGVTAADINVSHRRRAPVFDPLRRRHSTGRPTERRPFGGWGSP